MGFGKSKAVAITATCPVEIEGLGTLNITYRCGMINRATTERMKQDDYYVLKEVITSWDFEDDEATAAARLEDENAPAVMMPINEASLDMLGNPVCFELFQGIYQNELKKMKSRIKKA